MRLIFHRHAVSDHHPAAVCTGARTATWGARCAGSPWSASPSGGCWRLSTGALALILPEPLVTLLLVTALAIVTGALHLDGVADVADGFGARGGRERFLAVMKDSGTGAIGVVGVVLVLLLKYQALLHLPAELRFAAIFLFPAVARFGQVLLTAGSLRARDDGLGATFATGAGYRGSCHCRRDNVYCRLAAARRERGFLLRNGCLFCPLFQEILPSPAWRHNR